MKKILIIDDEEKNIDILSKMMKKIGEYNIITAKTCTEAGKMIYEHPDLIVLDIMITQDIDEELMFPKDYEGFFLYLYIQRNLNIPTIVSTARTDDRVKKLATMIFNNHFKKETAKDLGFTYWQKPINFEEIKRFLEFFFQAEEQTEKKLTEEEKEKQVKKNEEFENIVKNLKTLNHYINHFSSIIMFMEQQSFSYSKEEKDELEQIKKFNQSIRRYSELINDNLQNIDFSDGYVMETMKEDIEYIENIKFSLNESTNIIYRRNILKESVNELGEEDKAIAEEMENFSRESIYAANELQDIISKYIQD